MAQSMHNLEKEIVALQDVIASKINKKHIDDLKKKKGKVVRPVGS